MNGKYVKNITDLTKLSNCLCSLNYLTEELKDPFLDAIVESYEYMEDVDIDDLAIEFKRGDDRKGYQIVYLGPINGLMLNKVGKTEFEIYIYGEQEFISEFVRCI